MFFEFKNFLKKKTLLVVVRSIGYSILNCLAVSTLKAGLKSFEFK